MVLLIPLVVAVCFLRFCILLYTMMLFTLIVGMKVVASTAGISWKIDSLRHKFGLL